MSIVVRVKVVSAVKYEVPDLPAQPTPVVKQKTRITDNNNSNKKKHNIGVAPMRSVDPAPAPLRLARSLISDAGRYHQRRLMGWRYQEIKIKKILKGFGLVENTEKTQAQIRNNNRTIRYKSRMYVSPFLHLKPGRAYILAGKIIANRLFLSKCNWYAAWGNLSLSQIRGLKKIRAQGCKCHIQLFCHYPECENTKAKDVCMWKPQGFYPIDDCRYHHSLCRKRKGNCQWIDGEGYHKCIKNKLGKSNGLP
jgi:hypothetical protein